MGKFCWSRDRLPTPLFLGFPGGSAGKESTKGPGSLAAGLLPRPESVGGHLPARLHVSDKGGQEIQATSCGLTGVYKHWPSLNSSFSILFDLIVDFFFFCKKIQLFVFPFFLSFLKINLFFN